MAQPSSAAPKLARRWRRGGRLLRCTAGRKQPGALGRAAALRAAQTVDKGAKVPGIVASEDDWKILYRAADMALYRAKTGGRDRFILIRPQTAAA